MGAIDRVFRGRRGGQDRPLAAQVASLFANGEQGLWYDVEGFRDSWSSVGPELLPEGSFDSATGWNSIEPGWTVSGGKASVNNSSGSTARLQRGLVPPIDRWYLITLEVSSISSGSLFITHGGGTGPAYTKPGKYSFFNYRTANFSLYIGATTGTVAEIESISVKEWTGLQLCALYQDATGTLPAYLPGQGQVDPPVGLVLDRRKTLSRGPELLSNGDFSAGAASWSVQNADATHVATFSGGTLRYQSDTTSPVMLISQVGVPIVAGRWYEVTITVSSWASGGIKTDTLNGNAASGLTLAQGAGTFRSIGLATASTSSFGFSRSSANVDLTIDSISVREVLGNHAYQTTTASRPTLSARYNLLTYTDDFSNVIWGAPTNFSATAGEPAPDGSPTAFKITSLSGAAATSQTVIAHPVGPIKFVIWMKAGTATSPTVLVRNNTTATALISMGYGSTTASTSYGTGFVTDMGGGWKKFTIVLTSGISAGDSVGYYYGATGAIPVGQYWWVWHPDVRQSNDGVGLPEYQRVNTASNYDVDGFPLYLKFDGVDDFLQTGNGDFTGLYAVSVFASCRKLNDAAQGMLVEASTAYTTGPDGRFALLAPAVGDTYGARYAAGADVANLNALAVASPNSSVLSMIVDANNATPANRLSIRRNGSGSGMQTNSTLAAPAAMGNWPIYIGRRAGASLPFNGRLYGLLIRAGAINDGQIQKVERFLNQKAKVF